MSEISVRPQSTAGGPFFISPPNASAQGAVQSLKLAAVLLTTPGVSFSAANPWFQLAVDGAKRSGTLSIAAAAWQFDGTALRANLRTYVDDFLLQVEAREAHGLIPGATGLVRAALAANTPISFEESLYVTCGLVRDAGPNAMTYVDLGPRMRLRLDTQASQFVAPASSRGGTLAPPLANGFVAGGQAQFDVVERYTGQGTQITLDAYLAGATVPVVEPSLGGAGGICDLLGADQRGRYMRLCYPRRLPGSDSVGSTSLQSSAALLWADDLDTLAKRTRAYYQASGDVPSAVFLRGRALPVPELCCLVNDTPTYVSVGTTVRQLVQRFAGLPRVPGLDPAAFGYSRWAPGLDDDSLRYGQLRSQGAGSTAIKFTVSSVPGPDAYDLPVLPGDKLVFHS